ncbi:MAG TPA: glycosyltransferase family 4 protein [Sporichthyaceae bacterium]|nr:glycosyltransferase family 4 protein [Sporichthyaceae bacterium]
MSTDVQGPDQERSAIRASAVRGEPARVSLLWITNISAPYRVPLWSALSDRLDLTVALLAEGAPNRHWKVALDDVPFRVVHCNSVVVQRNDYANQYYLPSRRLLRSIGGRPAVVLIDGWSSPAHLSALLLARALRVPVVVSYDSAEPNQRFRSGPVAAVRRWFLGQAAAVLTSGAGSTAAVRSAGVPHASIVQGFLGADVETFARGAALARSSEPSGPQPGHRYLYVGQLIERKNVANLIQAYAKIRNPADVLSVVGLGPLHDELLRVAEAVGGAVDFLGHLDQHELISLYGRSHTLVLPSLEEVWGLVANEALAAGLNVVVSRCAGVVDEIAGMPGVFVTEPTAAGLCDAMTESRSSWRGPRPDHPILARTPDALAQTIADLVAELVPSAS